MHPNFPQHATPETCKGKTFIITGANSGIGLEAVKHLANAQAERIIMGVRNLQAGERAKAEVLALPDVKDVKIEVWFIDLSKYQTVKTFTEKANTALDRIDGVVANAGIGLSLGAQAEGHGLVVTVNVLATLLFVGLMQPKLRAVAKQFKNRPSISVVGSSWGFNPECTEEWSAVKSDPLPSLDAIGREDDQYSYKTYRLSKVLVILIGRFLAQSLPISKTGVAINTLCPGLCDSNFSRGQPAEMAAYMAPMREQYGWSAEQGSRILTYALLTGEDTHGRYIKACKLADADLPQWAVSDDGARVVELAWKQVKEELKRVEPEFENVLFKI